jgi:RNA:NAD 2'-phosphotransferase (TPT1/KptA family)
MYRKCLYCYVTRVHTPACPSTRTMATMAGGKDLNVKGTRSTKVRTLIGDDQDINLDEEGRTKIHDLDEGTTKVWTLMKKEAITKILNLDGEGRTKIHDLDEGKGNDQGIGLDRKGKGCPIMHCPPR